MKKILASLVLFSVTQTTFGFANTSSDDTLSLTIINNSSQTLRFTGVSDSNVGNTFTMDNDVLTPGEKAVLTGTTMPYTDLAGAVNFTDSDNNSDIMTLLDPRKIKSSQGIFAMNNHNFLSFDTKTLNTGSNPLALNYNYVTLVIQDNVA